ncbi:hypothetical protein CUMW_199780 [Citrus unshiu]|nr:hypothetical protein CUMW_199780 [Citrus unshiu]
MRIDLISLETSSGSSFSRYILSRFDLTTLWMQRERSWFRWQCKAAIRIGITSSTTAFSNTPWEAQLPAKAKRVLSSEKQQKHTSTQ